MATLLNTGLIISAKRIGNVDAVDPVTYMNIGTSDTAENATQTALQAESAASGLERAAATVSYEADYKTKWVHEFTNGSGGDVGINEIGLANAAAASGTDQFMRHVFSSTINILDGASAEFTIRETHAQA